jgi:iron complex transport system ATP-binding protein
VNGPALEALGLAFGYLPDRPVLEGLDLRVERGEAVGLVGPNGAGKTTLLRLLAGIARPWRGEVRLLGEDLQGLGPRGRARRLALVPQESEPVFEFTALETVLMGRAPHLGLLGLEGPEDRRIALRALEEAQVLELAERSLGQLSGGERQRVIVARALAQEPEVLLLDEPTAHVDLGHKLALDGLLERRNREEGLTVVTVSHDLSHAARSCGRLVLMAAGAVMAEGTPAEVLTVENLRRAYGVEVSILEDPARGTPVVVPDRLDRG